MDTSLFIPFDKLWDELRFEYGPAGMAVYVGSREIWELKPTSLDGIETWKRNVRRALMRMSSTVVLQTKCGCTKRVDLSNKSELRGFRVPLLPYFGATLLADSTLPASTTRQERVFRWKGKYHRTGAKLLEES